MKVPSYIAHDLPYGIRPGNIFFVDDVIVDCRLRGIYKSLLRRDYMRVKFNISDMIDHLVKAPYIDLDVDIYKQIIDQFMHMRVDCAMKKYDDVHNRIREVHYLIENSYMIN